MKKLSKSEKGFSAVEGLLVILILVVIGAVGYMVYHNNHKAKTTSISNTTSKTSTSGSSTKSTLAAKPTTATIPINPLGVSITVPIALKGLTDAVTSRSPVNGDTSITVGLSTTSLTNIDPSVCSASETPLLNLTRVDGQYPSDATVYNTSGTLVKQFPTYYIAYAQNNGQTDCDTSSNAASMMSNIDLGDLIESNSGTAITEFVVQTLN